MIDPDEIARERRSLGSQLAHYRRAAGYTQHQLAPRTHYGRSTIANVEIGRQNVPRDFWQRCDRVLAAGGALIHAYEQLEVLVAQHRREIAEVSSATGRDNTVGARAITAHPSKVSGDLVESPLDIFDRLRRYDPVRITDSLLDALDAFVTDVSERYEEAGPVFLAPAVIRQRRWIERLSAVKGSADQQQRLFRIAGQLSGQLGYMAVNLGRFPASHAYCAEAFQLADLAGDNDLKAWVRGTESLAAYYQEDYCRAVAVARDGQRYATGGRQAVRLAVNGEARALAQLSDRRGAEEAVGRAYRVADQFPREHGMSACISFGLYSEARTASNAATAYLALGDTARVLEHADRARHVVDRSRSRWSQALVRLDTAAALVRARQPDVEHAVVFGRAAMAIVGDHRLESIQQRTRALAIDLRPWRQLPAVTEFLDETRVWLEADWKRGRGTS